jgi:hypothetical protein
MGKSKSVSGVTGSTAASTPQTHTSDTGRASASTPPLPSSVAASSSNAQSSTGSGHGLAGPHLGADDHAFLRRMMNTTQANAGNEVRALLSRLEEEHKRESGQE